MAKSRIGLWLIGAKGGVATTTIMGLIALKAGLADGAGLVSELGQFGRLELVEWADFVVGGHEIRQFSLADEIARLVAENRAIDPQLTAQSKSELEQIEGRIRPGTIYNVGPTIAALAAEDVPREETPAEAVTRLKQDLSDFAQAEKLHHVVVVNVASTEPPVDVATIPEDWDQLEPLLAQPCSLPASSLYAIATLDLGFSYINFTPSLGSALPAIDQLTRLRRTRHMGHDGKTGETLMKSVLAPMFAQRNLQVMSWVGHNIFGNLDGKVLDDPTNKRAKVQSKDRLLGEILGYQPQTLVSIEYIESMGDWKTAWDNIHFKGFLGTPMTLQFTWQGCDSILAAPLVLDLARFTELAARRGHVGQMPFLASFFKSPLGVEEQRFDRQFQMLESWANQ